jgi:uncharacterized membrane protein YeaQ/YmgE (transglycosylase-associated protein family)
MEKKELLPNATAVLVLGICSIVFSCFFVGFVVGIIGLSIGNKSIKMYKLNPEKYDGFGMLNAGWIMSIIGTVLGALYVLYLISLFVFIGTADFSKLNVLFDK